MKSATEVIKLWEQQRYGAKTSKSAPEKSAILGFDVLTHKPYIVDISKPLNALFYGKKGTGKSLFLGSWVDSHYLEGYTNIIAHDLHGEYKRKYNQNKNYRTELNEGAKAAGVSEEIFAPDYKDLSPFGWDKESVSRYSPEFITQRNTNPISLDILSLPKDGWLDRLGYSSNQSRKKRRAFEIIYDCIRKLKYENVGFKVTQNWIDGFLENPEKYIDEKSLKSLSFNQIEDVMNTIEGDLVKKKIVEGEHVKNLYDIFSPGQNIVFDYSKLSLFNQMISDDKTDPRDLYITVVISLFFEWIREMRDEGDRTPYRISLDEMQKILTGYKARGTNRQPKSLQSLGLFITQARKYGVGIDVAFQSGLNSVPMEVISQFDLICISDMPMPKTDRRNLEDTFKDFSDFTVKMFQQGFGSGRKYHFWVFDTNSSEVHLIVPYPNRSHKEGSNSNKRLKFKERTDDEEEE